MKNYLLPLSLLFLLAIMGCQSNKYEEYYSVLSDSDYLRVQEPEKLIELVEPSQMEKIQATGEYVLIGTSSFYDLWTPRTYAIDCAKKHGAALVVLSYKRGETQNRSMTINVPTSQTTYHNGIVYGRHGYYANFYGSSTTYGSTPVTVNFQNTYYQQNAFFFGKRARKNTFGVYFILPENTPGNTDKRIRVGIVVAKSKAEKSGIKPGDVVVSINGVKINTLNDITPFMDGTLKIERMVVTHE